MGLMGVSAPSLHIESMIYTWDLYMHIGVFHLILLAGAMNIRINQQDDLAGCKFHNVPLVSSPTASSMQVGVLWQTMKEATPCKVANGANGACTITCICIALHVICCWSIV